MAVQHIFCTSQLLKYRIAFAMHAGNAKSFIIAAEIVLTQGLCTVMLDA